MRYRAEAHGAILLSAAAHGYAAQADSNGGDSVVWQRGPRRPNGSRLPGLAQRFMQVLRSIGYLGEPVWTPEGTVVYYPPVAMPSRSVAMRLTGVWYNTLRAEEPTTPDRMAAVPKAVREAMKQWVAWKVPRQYIVYRTGTASLSGCGAAGSPYRRWSALRLSAAGGGTASDPGPSMAHYVGDGDGRQPERHS